MQDALFAIFSAWTLGFAALAIGSRRAVYNALGLGFSSLGTAALCALAAAPLLAAAQALVYGVTAGLVCAALFAALAAPVEKGRWRAYGAGLWAVGLFALLAYFLIGYRPVDAAMSAPVAAGAMLFGKYALALYMVAALLLAAVLAVAVLIGGGQSAEDR